MTVFSVAGSRYARNSPSFVGNFGLALRAGGCARRAIETHPPDSADRRPRRVISLYCLRAEFEGPHARFSRKGAKSTKSYPAKTQRAQRVFLQKNAERTES